MESQETEIETNCTDKGLIDLVLTCTNIRNNKYDAGSTRHNMLEGIHSNLLLQIKNEKGVRKNI